ncbi:TIM barrel protein [Candidatus Pacearchaeota archaeon]|nr:TIM barrel protein [Candidatus Pacearchaeota archaeon]
MIRFGPAGLGGVGEAVSNLKEFSRLGLKACEIAFTYGIYIKDKEAEEIRKAAEKYDIKLSIHAPYWINLNSNEKKKVEESKKRIIDCCKIGEKLGAYTIVFHPGYYGKMSKEESYENIKNRIIEIQEEIKNNKLRIRISAETTGKINVFGKEEEILKLVEDTGCFFCVDFAHILARNQGKISYKEIYEKFKNFDEMHIHFSGIEWGEKGEIKHKITEEKEVRKLIEALPKNKNIVVINESPMPVEDSVKALKLYNML